ncbi:MAG: sensor histidine kinase [Emticicia sp.]|uniref:sensor histidine kinase n=1 Tax=Emticicia sp. TaxID=1930953 RepID=UPI003BA3FD79
MAKLDIYGQNTQSLSTPSITISEVEIAGRILPIKKSYNIGYEDNAIEVRFSEPTSAVSYRFRIIENSFEGDKVHPWVVIPKNEIRVDTLSPAIYRFEVIAASTVSKQESSPLILEFKIEYPWWRSWWFWGACFVTLFGLFYGRERFLKFWADEEQRHYKQVTELELRTLQLQMNPHFVFNALNAVQSFILTRDSISANNYLSKFANLIRLFLDSSRSKYITLSDEIKLLSLYVEMEKLRFDNKFEFHLDISPDVNQFMDIPTMILQPFIENAINHGLRYKETKGNLYINFYNQGKFLVCRIEDDGVGRERAKQIQAKSRKGYQSQGLKITEERLRTFNMIADSDIRFSITDRLDSSEELINDVGTLIEIKFPKFG